MAWWGHLNEAGSPTILDFGLISTEAEHAEREKIDGQHLGTIEQPIPGLKAVEVSWEARHSPALDQLQVGSAHFIEEKASRGIALL